MITKTKMSIGPRLPYHFGEFYKQRLRNAFLAELGCLPQLAANIVIFQTNALFDGYFSSDGSSLANFSAKIGTSLLSAMECSKL
jgi:hypothetical protein